MLKKKISKFDPIKGEFKKNVELFVVNLFKNKFIKKKPKMPTDMIRMIPTSRERKG